VLVVVVSLQILPIYHMTGVRASRGAAPALPAETDHSKCMKDIPNTHYYTSLGGSRR
jgi:hypothetical protein